MKSLIFKRVLWVAVATKIAHIAFVATVSLLAPIAVASDINQLRLWRAPDNTRLVLDLDSGVQHQLFELQNPDRVVIDISDTQMRADVNTVDLSNTPLDGIRFGNRDDGSLRMVLDLNSPVLPRSFTLEPNDNYGHRLVIDLHDASPSSTQVVNIEPVTVDELLVPNRNVLIAIDAGHGGDDPGAIGPGNIFEKNVAMQIAVKLRDKINLQPGYEAFLVRTGDYYVALQERPIRARAKRADLFLSIHADAFDQPQVNGASVYALSQRGATSETASYLAQRENRADLIGGVGELSLRDKDSALASVLLDLSMTATLDTSLRIGQEVLSQVGGVTRLHKRSVEQAGFVVLKSPDMPSLLIETGFISNPDEARRLANSDFQSRLANAIFTGLRSYYEAHPPDGTLISTLETRAPIDYVIQRGDTLSAIAVRYNVTLDNLKAVNGISGSTIRVGQRLKIPAS